MTHHSEKTDQWEQLQDGIVGLGTRSIRKSYYPELKSKIRDLGEQRTFYQSTLNAIPDGVIVMDAQGKINQGNPALRAMFGYSNEELAGQDPSILYEGKSRTLRHDDFPAAICRRYVRKDGSAFIGETLGGEIHDEEGRLLGTLEVIRDLTERIAVISQQRKLEDQLRQSQKMAAIGTLAGGIAHDFNNLLAAILGNAELALLKLNPELPGFRELKQIVKAGSKASELVSQILAFSRKENTKRIYLHPGALLEEASKLLHGSIPSTIIIKEHIEAMDRLILANPTQLHQIIMNLCTNAYHAMEEQGGEMLISLRLVQKSWDQWEEAKEYVVLTVADNGQGMTSEVRQRIFEPYFTTKENGKGTGMGLAVVHGIVESHEGHIEVESMVGKGTTFTLYFPAVDGEELTPQRRKTDALIGGHESILLIDDEKMVADYIKTFLEQLGYRVSVCYDGLSALELFRRDPNAFDLVLTDQTMPGKTGFEVAKTMLRQRPTLPVILCSGYSSALSPDRVLQVGIQAFLMKPISVHLLGPKIRALLDEPSQANKNRR